MEKQESQTSCAIIVSFNPEVAVLLALLQQISRQCDFLLVDNHSSNRDEFCQQVAALPGCQGVEQLSKNRGLAAALNIGLSFAMRNGYDLALLLDQDSALSENFVQNMYSAYDDATALVGYKVAAIGPCVQNPESGRRMPFKRFDRFFGRTNNRPKNSTTLFCTDFLITSGTLLPLESICAIGTMNDEYFIDNIDLDWCFRARLAGYHLFGTDRAVLNHRIGEASSNPLVRMGLMVHHSPVRAYYSTRNRINLYGKRYAPLQWKIRDMIRFLLKSLWLLIFSAQRKDYWKNIRKGYVDARKML